MNREEYIIQKFAERGIALTDVQAQRFSEYFGLLSEWNARMNLTAITEFEEVVERHFLDSLAPLLSPTGEDRGDEEQGPIDITETEKIIDVGSGAGFPGIPMAILFSEKQVVLLDAIHKRSLFQTAVKEGLELNNLSIINGRAEDVSRETLHREAYDLVVSRAVADLSVLAEFCLPFATPGGLFVAYKGNDVADEVARAENAIRELGGDETKIMPYRTEPETPHRNLVIVRKTNKTPEKYPRRAGIPAKRPL